MTTPLVPPTDRLRCRGEHHRTGCAHQQPMTNTRSEAARLREARKRTGIESRPLCEQCATLPAVAVVGMALPGVALCGECLPDKESQPVYNGLGASETPLTSNHTAPPNSLAVGRRFTHEPTSTTPLIGHGSTPAETDRPQHRPGSLWMGTACLCACHFHGRLFDATGRVFGPDYPPEPCDDSSCREWLSAPRPKAPPPCPEPEPEPEPEQPVRYPGWIDFTEGPYSIPTEPVVFDAPSHVVGVRASQANGCECACHYFGRPMDRWGYLYGPKGPTEPCNVTTCTAEQEQ